MNYYDAKFAREAKPNPTQWRISHVGGGVFTLDYVGKQ